MKCGANAKPPSDDPCAACLGPGFISIMRSIYSVVMTWGYEKSRSLLKTQAHPPNPVWKDGLIHRWTSHDMSAHTKRTCYHCSENWFLSRLRRYRKCMNIMLACDVYALDLISKLLLRFVLTLKPIYDRRVLSLFSVRDGSVFEKLEDSLNTLHVFQNSAFHSLKLFERFSMSFSKPFHTQEMKYLLSFTN